jgi:hypothetical protein
MVYSKINVGVEVGRRSLTGMVVHYDSTLSIELGWWGSNLEHLRGSFIEMLFLNGTTTVTGHKIRKFDSKD